MAKYFIDTCIWRDFYENRISKKGRYLGHESNQLFQKIIKEKITVLVSDSITYELGKKYTSLEINDMMNLLFVNGLLKRIETTKEEIVQTNIIKNKKNIPFIDCLIAIQAKNHGAIVITQDKHFFNELKDIVKIKRPI